MCELIFHEHLYRSLPESILSIGKQRVNFTPEEAVKIAKYCGIKKTPNPGGLALETGLITIRSGADKNRISDHALLSIAGVKNISSLDISDYEGAEVIHDITKPVPKSLVNAFEFVCDGGTSDNVFDPAISQRNLAAITKPFGRLVATNMASNHQTPYVIFNPVWFLDYFIVNKFIDCKVYICVFKDMQNWNVFTYDFEYLATNPDRLLNIETPYRTLAIVLAEKGEDSTENQTPTQWQYRSDADKAIYIDNLKYIQNSTRPDLLHSNCERFVDKTPEGYKYIPQKKADGALDRITRMFVN